MQYINQNVINNVIESVSILKLSGSEHTGIFRKKNCFGSDITCISEV